MKIGYLTGLTLSLLAMGGAQASIPAKKWIMNVDSGAVEFNAIGRPSALKIHGKGSAPKGTLTVEGGAASGQLIFDLESLDTGIKMRNEHMKQKYLEVGKYSKATLTLTKIAVSPALFTETGKSEPVPFQGKLHLHGIEKPVTGTAKLERNGDQLSVDAQFGIKISDYGIVTPSFSGITMAEDVNVAVQLTTPVVSQ